MLKISAIFLGGALLASAACGVADEETARPGTAATSLADSKTVPDGMAVFRKNCVVCHGTDGTLGLNGAKDLTQSVLPLEERVNIITHGKKLMTPFGTVLGPGEIQAVAEYTQSLKK